MKPHEFVRYIWRDQPGDVFFLAHMRRGSPRGMRNVLTKGRGIAALIADIDPTRELYFVPSGFSADCNGRREGRYVRPSHWITADFDDPARAAHAFAELPPTMAVETSPGHFHAYWRTTTASGDFSLGQRITQAFGADHGGWNGAKLLRLPGTINHKPEHKGWRVRLAIADGPIYTRDELGARYPAPHGPDGVAGGDIDGLDWRVRPLRASITPGRGAAQQLRTLGRYVRRHVAYPKLAQAFADAGATPGEFIHSACRVWFKENGDEKDADWLETDMSRLIGKGDLTWPK